MNSLPERTFGVEIECAMPRARFPSAECVTVELKQRGFDFNTPGHKNYGRWSIHGDGGSLDTLNYWGCEIITPILCGEQGLAELTRMMAALKEMGALGGWYSGMHVHIGTDGLAPEQRLNWWATMLRYEPCLQQIVAPRRSGTYCYESATAPVCKNGVETMVKLPVTQEWALHGWGNNGTWDASKGYIDMPIGGQFGRSRRGYPTCEIRIHQGTVDGEKAAHWVRLLLHICEIGKDLPPQKDRVAGKTWAAFASVLMRFGLPKATRDYWLAIRQAYIGKHACEDMPKPDLDHAAQLERITAARQPTARAGC